MRKKIETFKCCVYNFVSVLVDAQLIWAYCIPVRMYMGDTMV